MGAFTLVLKVFGKYKVPGVNDFTKYQASMIYKVPGVRDVRMS